MAQHLDLRCVLLAAPCPTKTRIEFCKQSRFNPRLILQSCHDSFQGEGEHKITCATSPFYLNVNKTRLADLKKQASSTARVDLIRAVSQKPRDVLGGVPCVFVEGCVLP